MLGQGFRQHQDSRPRPKSRRRSTFLTLQQQAKFDAFVQEFNTERPHEALDMKRPADLYRPSLKPFLGLNEITYPFHDRDILVTACGRICMHRKKTNISSVHAGQKLGIKEVDDGIWLVSFMRYDLGYFDLEQKTPQPLDNPFGPRLSPMSWVRSVTHVSGAGQWQCWCPGRDHAITTPGKCLKSMFRFLDRCWVTG